MRRAPLEAGFVDKLTAYQYTFNARVACFAAAFLCDSLPLKTLSGNPVSVR